MIVEELGWDSGSKVNVAINLILTLWSETLGKFETKILHLLISQVFSCCFRFSVRLYCIFSEWNKKNNNKYLINEEMHKFGFWIFPKFHSTVLRSSWLQHLFYCLNPSRGKLKNTQFSHVSENALIVSEFIFEGSPKKCRKYILSDFIDQKGQ